MGHGLHGRNELSPTRDQKVPRLRARRDKTEIYDITTNGILLNLLYFHPAILAQTIEG